MTLLGLAAILVVALYLVLFFAASRLAAEAAGRPIWLFDQARGRERMAALGFRAAFVLALLGPLAQAVWPTLSAGDPLWGQGGTVSAMAGLLMAVAGAMLAWGSQVAMGASWRVGVTQDAVGALVTAGPFRLSRNPTFAGQLLLLAGAAVAVPSLTTLLGVALYWLSARAHIAAEEAALRATHGAAFDAYAARVPRWLGLSGRGLARRPATPAAVDTRRVGL